jgi:DNA-binding NtrC family response regulator
MLQVLMVDDDPGQLRIRERVLRLAGIEVSLASNAEGALEILRSRGAEIGVVITDHLLPGLQGTDLVRELRRFNPSIPVLVLTGLPDIESEYDGLDAIVRVKPLPPGELIRLVHRLMAFAENGPSSQSSSRRAAS